MSRTTTTDSYGYFGFDELGSGYYVVDVLGPRLTVIASQGVELYSDQELEMKVPCLSLGGNVVTPGGFGIPRAEVWLDSAVSGIRVATTRSGRKGSFTLRGLPPGRYYLLASVGNQVSAEYDVELVDSPDNVDIVVEAQAGLELMVMEPSGEPAQRIEVHPMLGDRRVQSRWAECGSDGLCRVEDIDVGLYDLLVRGWYGAAVLQVAVPSDITPVRLVPEGTLEIRISPEVPDEGHHVRVRTADGIVIPPASFLERWAWQPVPGLLTVPVPAGAYVVELHTARGRIGWASVDVPPNGRAGVLVEPDR
jgi:hypothetical protein